MDYYLKFSDAAEAQSVLYDGEQPRYQAIDVIGTIWKPTNVMLTTDEGEVPQMAPVDGWHVNVRTDAETPELEPYAVQVLHPVRVWA